MSAAAIPTYPDLAGKTAFVTGGSKGIGLATCRALAANGVNVAVVARGDEGVKTTAAELESSGARAIGIVADCTSFAAIEEARRLTEERLGPVEILLPFAGGVGGRTPTHEISEEEWRFVIESNLTATFLTVKSFLPGMMERRRGSIVTMASITGRYLDVTLTSSYAAAKAGIVHFTRHLAKEVGEYGIRANVVAPGTTTSERVLGVWKEEGLARVAALSPLGRLGTPEDSAFATLFLASESSGWITGITLDVAGGRIML